MIGRIRLILYKLKYRKHFCVGHSFHSRRGLFVEIVKPGILEIGSNCFMNNYCSINCLKHITIGDGCIFGENVKIYDHNHVFKNNDLIINQGFSCRDVTIGNNVWVASNVTILAGTRIGDNCVIGAGVVLNGVIPENSLVRNDMKYTIDIIRKNKEEEV